MGGAAIISRELIKWQKGSGSIDAIKTFRVSSKLSAILRTGAIKSSPVPLKIISGVGCGKNLIGFFIKYWRGLLMV